MTDKDTAPAPHDPGYFREKAREMLKQADQAVTEDDRQAFRALAEAYGRRGGAAAYLRRGSAKTAKK